jgi:hypothetical protein
MSRPRERVCLQDGLKLDLNRLARKGFIKHGTNIGVRGITWTHSYWDEIATGFITADMSGNDEGWFRIQLGSLDQRITLVARSAPLWRQAMVLRLSRDEPSRIGGLEAARRNSVLQPANLGPAGRVPVPIQRCDEPGTCWKGSDQVASDCRPRPGRMGFATETEMDAVGYLQSARTAIRPLRVDFRPRLRGSRCIARKRILLIINERLQVRQRISIQIDLMGGGFHPSPSRHAPAYTFSGRS